MEKKKRMKKRWRIIIVVVVFLFIAANLAALGWFMGRGPFGLLHTYRYTRLEGNADIYRPETVELLESSPLAGKEIIFLGSSVTEGSAALGNSMAAYLGNRFCSEVVVEAVSGTTLVDTGNDSYVQRLERNLDTDLQPSLFVCQLSTNDATKGKPLGTIGDGFAREDFDTATIAGAMEYIISYAQETWDCPVMFYTGSRYDSATYEEMVALLPALQEKWGIGVIDLWNDDAFNTITREERALYMSDNIHPTMAGYKEWWSPEMERQILEYLEEV